MTGDGFWSMGGYARFVWPCFALASLILAWNVWSARRHRAAARLRARRALAMAAGEMAAGDMAAGKMAAGEMAAGDMAAGEAP